MSSFLLSRRGRGLSALSSVLALLAALLLISATGASAGTGRVAITSEQETSQESCDGSNDDSASIDTNSVDSEDEHEQAPCVQQAPTASVTKTNNADGSETAGDNYSPEETATTSGAPVPFRVRVVNTSVFSVVINSVWDTVDGGTPFAVDASCPSAVGVALAPQAVVDCLFTLPDYSPADRGVKTDVATVYLSRVWDQRALRRAAIAPAPGPVGTPVSSLVSTVHTAIPVVVPPVVVPPVVVVPTAVVTKTNNADQSETTGENFHATETATSVGADVRFRLHVLNTSAFPVDVSAVTDQVTGGEATPVSCAPALTLAAGASGDCFYTLPGYTPADGVTKANVATVYLTRTQQLFTLRRFAAASVVPAGTPVLSTTSSVTTHVPPVVVPVVPAAPAPPARPVVVPPLVQDLGLAKSGPGAAHPGDELVWTLDVTNVKGTPATGFTVTDALPAGTSYSSAEGVGFVCTHVAAVIRCRYTGSLAVGDSAHIVVRALLLEGFAGTTVDNTAVVDPGRSDADAANNSATATTSVTPAAAPVVVPDGPAPVAGSGGGEAAGPAAVPTAPQPSSADGSGLPFTGWATARTLQAGLALLLIGLLLSLAARARRLSR
jgi:uncharacterized repeat protein (TIGR01451 family)